GVGAGSTRSRIVDPARTLDPPDFWIGYQLRLLDPAGKTASTATVAAFDAQQGVFELSEPLTSDPRVGQSYQLSSAAEAPVLAIRYLLGLRVDQPIGPISVRLGTTRGTNALITRRGARTALVTTRGFGDILHIGYQNRPRLFDLAIRKREPL